MTFFINIPVLQLIVIWQFKKSHNFSGFRKFLVFYVGDPPWNLKKNKMSAAKSKFDENCKDALRNLGDFFKLPYC